MSPATDDRLRRWRLVLGGDDADGTGIDLTGDDAKRDEVLRDLYGESTGGAAGGRRESLSGQLPISDAKPWPALPLRHRDVMGRESPVIEPLTVRVTQSLG